MLIYANSMHKFFVVNIFALTQDTSTKLDTNLDLDEVHHMT